MSLAAGTRLGPYEITSALGAGGMGEVFRARDTRLGRDVALKVLPAVFAQDAERLARFRREAQLLAALNDAHIAAIHGLEEIDGVVALALELAPGEDLAQRLNRGPIPVDEALAIARQIAEGLEAAHEHGIVHRDLKPANIKVTPEGKVKILDFGLAKAWEGEAAKSGPDLSHSPTMTRATEAGMILGTAAYMSPEQARGKPVDKRADIWAFGVVLYEMITGRPLFSGETVSDTMAGVLKNEIDFGQIPSGTPPSVRMLLRHCLERDPKDRLHDIADARIVLQGTRDGAAEGSAAAVRIPASPRARTWPLFVAAAVAAALGVGAGLFLRPSAPPLPVIRAAIIAPDDTELEPIGGAPGPITVSPDGARLAFTARDGAGVTRLYVQSLDTGKTRLIPASEDARYPFWSPDGRSLGFFNGHHLLRVEVAEGAPVALAPVDDRVRGGTWGASDVIVYAPSSATALLQVPARGGGSVPASVIDPGRREGTHRFPSFLPDGRRFLYATRGYYSWMRAQDGIVVGSIDDPSQRVPLLPFATNATYVAGRLLFVRNGDLYAQDFDPDRLVLSGPASVLVRDVRYDRRFSLGAFSAVASGPLALQHGAAQDATELVWLDRGGRRLEVVRPAAHHDSLALSPDGSRVVLTVFDPASSRSHIEVFDLGSRKTTRLTSGEADDYGATWSADGSRVLFARVDEQGIGVWTKHADGFTAERRFRPQTADEILYPLGSSPDGRHVLFMSLIGGSLPAGFWTLPASGEGAPKRYTDSRAEADMARFSPDGRWVVFDANEGKGPRTYVARFPDTGERWQLADDDAIDNRWTRAGRELVYRNRVTDQLTAVSVDLSGGGPRFGQPRPLFALPDVSVFGTSFDVSPDGERILALLPVQPARRTPYTVIFNWERLLEASQ